MTKEEFISSISSIHIKGVKLITKVDNLDRLLVSVEMDFNKFSCLVITPEALKDENYIKALLQKLPDKLQALVKQG